MHRNAKIIRLSKRVVVPSRKAIEASEQLNEDSAPGSRKRRIDHAGSSGPRKRRRIVETENEDADDQHGE